VQAMFAALLDPGRDAGRAGLRARALGQRLRLLLLP
jgi:hypothetical protein